MSIETWLELMIDVTNNADFHNKWNNYGHASFVFKVKGDNSSNFTKEVFRGMIVAENHSSTITEHIFIITGKWNDIVNNLLRATTKRELIQSEHCNINHQNSPIANIVAVISNGTAIHIKDNEIKDGKIYVSEKA